MLDTMSGYLVQYVNAVSAFARPWFTVMHHVSYEIVGRVLVLTAHVH